MEVYEILDKVSRAKKEHTKLAALKKNATPALQTILLLNFHPEMKFVSFSEVSYLKSTNPSSSLNEEYHKLGMLTEGGGKMKGTDEQIRQMYVEILSSIHEKDAAIIESCKRESLEQDYGITLEMAKEAFPDLSWE